MQLQRPLRCHDFATIVSMMINGLLWIYILLFLHSNMSFTTCPIRLQWEKELENDINNLKSLEK